MELSKQIKKHRNEMGLRQEEFAEKIYVTRQTVSNWENEKSYPDIHSLLLMSSLFGISVDQLIKGDLEMMERKINQTEVEEMKRYVNIFGFMLLATIITFVPLILYLGIWGGIVTAVLFIFDLILAVKIEKIKKQNDIQTYKEIKAFYEGENLEEIMKNREMGKRGYQKIIMAVGTGLITFIVLLVLSKLFGLL